MKQANEVNFLTGRAVRALHAGDGVSICKKSEQESVGSDFTMMTEA